MSHRITAAALVATLLTALAGPVIAQSFGSVSSQSPKSPAATADPQAATPTSAPTQAFSSVTSSAPSQVPAAGSHTASIPSAPAPVAATPPEAAAVATAAPLPAPLPFATSRSVAAAAAAPVAAIPAGVAPAALPFSSISNAGGTGDGAAGAGPSLPVAGSFGGVSFDLADRIVIEKAARRLYLLRGDSVLVEYPVKLGLNPYGHKQREGDFRTPEGTYYLSRRNPNSEFFLSVEVSYPNEADRARARQSGVRPGGLIMIHGQPNVPRKSPDYYANNDWTDGCIAVSNSDMVDIWQRTRLGIPIEIRP
jgi:hypothetical protein